MTEVEQRLKIKNFIKVWTGKGYEKGQSQPFWIQLLRCLGVENSEQYISFEDQVHLDHTSFIDGFIDKTKVMIEQKSIDKDLSKAIKQSDETLLNPFQQAKRYISELPLSKHPRWVITCNFKEFYIYDMEKPNGEPEIIKLANLEKEYYRLSFLIDSDNSHIRKEMEVSMQAGEIVGLIYESLLKQYKNSENEGTLKSLNKLCVRLVFCLYAEDAGIFGKHDMFFDYMKQFESKHFRTALIDLFKILNTKPEDRDPYLEEELAKFPYVNGGLFEDDNIEIPNFTDEIRELLLTKASADFDWSEISPTIFGAVFESTLNPETRRKGGMHYTSIENIHKVIDPLFMDSLKEKFKKANSNMDASAKTRMLKNLQKEISSLKFLDPACGSGNFLTETYISLRKLENDILGILFKGQGKLGFVEEGYNPIQVSINQFYGIEINDFAVTVAKTALWIAESQMMKKTEDIVHMDLDFLPLKTYTNIVEGNALRLNWEDVISKDKCNYIMGNPPFVGYKLLTKSQKSDLFSIMPSSRSVDYVVCWYYKAAIYMENTLIQAAFVSTNSICQGDAIQNVWKDLLYKHNVEINFAHRTFQWDSEANLKAHVHCVIVGFSVNKINRTKTIYFSNNKVYVNNINPYLIDAENIIFDRRSTPISNSPQMTKGAQLIDGGHFIFETETEMQEFLNKNPKSKPYIYRYLNAQDFINNTKKQYCLYLENCSPNEIREITGIYERVNLVREYRTNSEAETTRILADKPTKYFQSQVPNSQSIVVPVVSSENRKYIPISFMPIGYVYTNALFYIDNANIYHFGVLCSNVHNAWLKVLCGRLKSDYRYSNTIVYNNFPWCNPTDEQKVKIEKTAQGILDARALYPECSLADLYDELTMPPELRKAHQENDKAVMEAYGFKVKDKESGKMRWLTESETIAELMKMYQLLTGV